MATRSDAPQGYQKLKTPVSGAGCFWVLFIIGGIAWFIMLFFGPFAYFEAKGFIDAANENVTGVVTNKKTDSQSGYTFYVLELAPAQGEAVTESVTVNSRVYDVVQVGNNFVGIFENDDHLLNATISDANGVVARITNGSTEVARETSSLVVTIIWGVLTAILIAGWFLRPKPKGRTLQVPNKNSQSVPEGTLMIGSLAAPPKMPDLRAFPPGTPPLYFPPPQQANQFSSWDNDLNSLPPSNSSW
jgi:hypothetical protein